MSYTKDLIMTYEEASTADREVLVRTYPEFFGVEPKPKIQPSNPDIDLLQAPTVSQQPERTVVGESTPLPRPLNQNLCSPSEIVKGDVVKLEGEWYRVVRIDLDGEIIIRTARGLDAYPVTPTTRFIPYLEKNQ